MYKILSITTGILWGFGLILYAFIPQAEITNETVTALLATHLLFRVLVLEGRLDKDDRCR